MTLFLVYFICINLLPRMLYINQIVICLSFYIFVLGSLVLMVLYFLRRWSCALYAAWIFIIIESETKLALPCKWNHFRNWIYKLYCNIPLFLTMRNVCHLKIDLCLWKYFSPLLYGEVWNLPKFFFFKKKKHFAIHILKATTRWISQTYKNWVYIVNNNMWDEYI